MAFLLRVRKSPATAYLRCASTRRFCSIHPSEEVLGKISSFVPNVVAVSSYFHDRENPQSSLGVILDRRVIVTSAHTVGRIDTFSEAKGEHWSIRHNSCIGSTVAQSLCTQPLKTKPLAVNFANDIAILEVLDEIPTPKGSNPCLLADSPLRLGDFLMNVGLEQDRPSGIVVSMKYGWVRAVGARTIGAKAPWPMEDGLGWIGHDCGVCRDSVPVLKKSNSRERVTGSIGMLHGSPLFDIDGKVAGISSWEVRYEGAPQQMLRYKAVGDSSWEVREEDFQQHMVRFAVPQSAIRSALEYAQTKGPGDPVVMDRWISNHG